MSVENHINVTGGNAQVGGPNTQIINPTTNNNPTIINNELHVSFNTYYLGNDPQPVAQNSTASHHLTREQLQQLSQSGLLTEHAVQKVTDVVVRQHSTELTSQSCDECIIRTRPQCSKCGQRTTPGQSVPPPSQAAEESTKPPESPQSPQSRRPLSDHQQSRNRRRAADRKQISSRRNKLTYGQPSNQTPGCSESVQRSRVPAEQTVPSTQPAPTETPDDIQIFDSKRRVPQPGDGVRVGFGFPPLYYGVFAGNMQVIRCDEETQKVIIEKLVSEQFNRLALHSRGRCKIFPAQMRVERARSCIGKVSPVWETWWGLDFVYWTFTGLNVYQAWEEGFRLC